MKIPDQTINFELSCWDHSTETNFYYYCCFPEFRKNIDSILMFRVNNHLFIELYTRTISVKEVLFEKNWLDYIKQHENSRSNNKF